MTLINLVHEFPSPPITLILVCFFHLYIYFVVYMFILATCIQQCCMKCVEEEIFPVKFGQM